MILRAMAFLLIFAVSACTQKKKNKLLEEGGVDISTPSWFFDPNDVASAPVCFAQRVGGEPALVYPKCKQGSNIVSNTLCTNPAPPPRAATKAGIIEFQNFSEAPSLLTTLIPTANILNGRVRLTCGDFEDLAYVDDINEHISIDCGSVGQSDDGNFFESLIHDSNVYICANKVQSVTIGYSHACALTMAGDIYCWGTNGFGESGRPPVSVGDSTRYPPQKVQGSHKYIQVSAGRDYTCAITTNNKLHCWGSGHYGQLGNGTKGTSNNIYTPTAIDSSTNYIKVETSENHTCAITNANKVKCFGENFMSQLGTGDSEERLTPTEIDSGENYTDISLGIYSSCGITQGQKIKCWGSNSSQFMGEPSSVGSILSTPILVDSSNNYTKISVGLNNICAIRVETGGTKKLYCWGNNEYGQMSNGTAVTLEYFSSPQAIDSGNEYNGVSAGFHSICANTKDNVLKCWGSNLFSQSIYSLDATINTATVVSESESFTYVAKSKSSHISCAITGGLIKCWGHNDNGFISDSPNESVPPTFINPF